MKFTRYYLSLVIILMGACGPDEESIRELTPELTTTSTTAVSTTTTSTAVVPDTTASSTATTSLVPGVAVVVERVIDGDTIDLLGGERVRIIGIDTPEEGDCGYEDAKQRLENLILGRVVLIIPVEGLDDRDRYDRLLRYVNLNGLDVGRLLIDEGLADARYDSLDGYPRHPAQDEYRLADSTQKDVC